MMRKSNNQTKSKIVSAAWQLFYDQGFDNTTVDEIIRLSGTSKGSYTQSWKNSLTTAKTPSIICSSSRVSCA